MKNKRILKNEMEQFDTGHDDKRNLQRIILTVGISFVIVVVAIVGWLCYTFFSIPNNITDQLRNGEYESAYSTYEKNYENRSLGLSHLQECVGARLDELETAIANSEISYENALAEVETIARMRRLHFENRIYLLQTLLEEYKENSSDANHDSDAEQASDSFGTITEGIVYVSADTPGHAGIGFMEKPDEAAALLEMLQEGTAVEKTSMIRNGYTNCKFNDQYGWVLSQYLVDEQRKSITVTVLSAENEAFVSGADITVYADDALSEAVATGITDRYGVLVLAVPFCSLIAKVECDEYVTQEFRFDMSDGKTDEHVIRLSPAEEPTTIPTTDEASQTTDDSFKMYYNAALDAYYDILCHIENPDMVGAECVDVSGDGIPELITNHEMSANVYSYDAATGEVVHTRMINYGFGDCVLRINTAENYVISSSGGRGFYGYKVSIFEGSRCVGRYDMAYCDGYTDEPVGYFIDDAYVSEEEYIAKVRADWGGASEVSLTVAEVLQKLSDMKL